MSGNAATTGGGIYADQAKVTLSNATISGNTAAVAGAIMAGGQSYYFPVTLTNSTVSGNAATNTGGIRAVATNVTAKNSIIAGNTHGDLDGGSLQAASVGNLIGVNPVLGALQDNGGETWTELPLSGSPAIDGGDDASCLAVDQRGVARPQSAHCDIGAVEVEHPWASFSDGSDYARYGETRTWTLTVTNIGSSDLTAVSVQGNASAEIDATSVQWSCAGSTGSQCTTNGTGPLVDANVVIPAGGYVNWAITAKVRPDAAGGQVTLGAHVDGTPGGAFEVADTDTLVLFRDGFDVTGGDRSMRAAGR